LLANDGAADASTISASTSAISAGGSALGAVAAPLAVYSAATGWQQGNYVGNTLHDAAAGAAIGSVVPVIGTLVGGAIGAVAGLVSTAIKGTHTQDEITNPSEGTTIKLQSGNSALENDGVAYGAGSSRAQGSSQWFLDPATSGTLDYNAATGQQNLTANNGDPKVTAGTPFWIGKQGSDILTNFANSVPMTNGQPDFTSTIAQYNANPNSGTGLVGVYNNNGGQATWGVPFSQWVQGVWQDKNGVTGNLGTTG
jgi:hypothetical protein